MSKTPQTLTFEETGKLLDELRCINCNPAGAKLGLRNYTIALLMLDAGLRVGETVQLLVSDLVLQNEPVRALHVRAEITKNHAEGLIPLSQRCQKAIKTMQHIWWTPFIHYETMYAFFTTESCNCLSVRQVERIITAAAEKVLGRPVHPHILRHTFGTRIERRGGIRVAQELLRHKNITSTQIYTHPNEDDKRKAIDGLEDGL